MFIVKGMEGSRSLRKGVETRKRYSTPGNGRQGKEIMECYAREVTGGERQGKATQVNKGEYLVRLWK